MKDKKTIEEKTKKRYQQEFNNFLDSKKDFEEYIKENIKNKKELSKLKCGIKYAAPEEKNNYLKIIEPYFYKKPKYKKKPEEQFKTRNIQNAINRLKNKRLKLAFRLQMISGLRVEELSRLSLDDIGVEEDTNRLVIHIKEGKYSKERYVKCLPDKWVYEELINIEKRKNENLFYSTSHLMNIANKLNFHTHDLRKTFANIKFYNNVSKNAVEELQEDLGHCKNTKTYFKYINRDINLTNTRWDKLKPLENERKIDIEE